MRVIIVRHYKTLSNAAGKIMGCGDAPRSQDWEIDLAYVNNVLRERDISFDAVYSSHLERARQSAIYFARARGIAEVRDIEALNEVNYGTLYGKRKKWVIENFPQYKTDPDFVFPCGESFRQMQDRSVNFLLSIEHSHRQQTLLVVVHAGVIRGFICHFLNLDFAANLKQKISHRYIGDFRIEDGACTYYDELGKSSGFLKSGSIRIPVVEGARKLKPTVDRSRSQSLIAHPLGN